MPWSLPALIVWRVSLYAALGTVLVGYYDGTMNGILEMESFKSTFKEIAVSDNLTDMMADNSTCSSENEPGAAILIGLMVATSNLGSAGGSLLAGWLSDKFSRKYGIVISGMVLGIGTVIASASYYIWSFIIGRVIAGIGVGIVYMVVPIYISEMSPKEWRGMLTSLIGVGYATGLLVALSTNIGFSLFLQGWRVALAVQSLAGFLFALGMIGMTHTPRWLVMKKRDNEALLILTKVNKRNFVDSFLEVEELKETLSSQQYSSFCNVLKEILRWKYSRRLILVIMLFFVLSSTGNFLYYYTTTLFCGVSIPSQYAALSVGFIGLVSTMVLPLFIDKVGRKVSLICGSTINMTLALITASLILVYGADNIVVASIVVVLICVYAFSTDCTWLTIPFVVTSEIFPINIRGLAVALGTASYWTFTFLINQVTPYVLGSTPRFFYIVAGISLLSLLLVLFALPETKGVSLEHMDEVFSQGCLKSCYRTRCLRRCENEVTGVQHADVATLEDEKYQESIDEKEY